MSAAGMPAGLPVDYYDSIYEVERSHWWHHGMRLIEEAILAGRLRPGLDVLDAGCGTGGFLRWMLDTCPPARACGVDLGQNAIALASGRVPEAELHVRPLNRLPFESASFDLVVMNDVLQHVPDPDVRESLKEVRRVSRDSGALLVRSGGARRTRREREDWRVYDREDLRATLEAAGWRCLRVTYVNVLGSLAAAVRGQAPRAPDDKHHGIPAPASGVQNAIGRVALAAERRYLASSRATLPYGHTLIALATPASTSR